MELRNPQRSYRPYLRVYSVMPNALRQAMPRLHQALEQHLSDQVQYKRGSADPFETTASPLPTSGTEYVQNGNVMRFFMSLSQCGGIAPQRTDAIIFSGTTYKIFDIEADDYNGYTISVRA